jgi:hypothetical protein
VITRAVAVVQAGSEPDLDKQAPEWPRANARSRSLGLKATMTPTVTSAAYLGLAVPCWGGLAAFSSHPALVALPLALCMMGGAAFFAQGNLNPCAREDCNNRSVFAAFGLIGARIRPPR